MTTYYTLTNSLQHIFTVFTLAEPQNLSETSTSNMTSATYFTISPSPKISRRNYPLTPSSVSPPALTTHSGRPELPRSHTAPKATALLSKVALTSPSSRRGSPNSSPPGSPPQEKLLMGMGEKRGHFGTSYHEKDGRVVQRESGEWVDELRDWRASEQREGYISFPDFERFCQQYQHDSQEQLEKGQQTLKS